MARRIYLNNVLPQLLKERGWSQERLASESKIARTDINAICKGRLSVGEKRLQRIADALGVTFVDLGVEEPARVAGDSGRLVDRVAALEAGLEDALRELAELRRDRGDEE